MKLFGYQIRGAEFLASKRCAILADEQGVGKTAQAITACDLVGAEKILVVCRAIARANWASEFDKFSPRSRRCAVVYDTADLDLCAEADVVIASFERVHDVVCRMQCLRGGLLFDTVIVDEAHYVKNPEAKRTKQILGTDGLLHKTRRMWLLTGTPAPNNASEMWPFLFVFGATKLNRNDFVNTFCQVRKTGFGDQIIGTKTDDISIDRLKAMMSKVLMRRTKEDVQLELPSISYGTVTVQPGPVNVAEHFGFYRWKYPVDRLNDLNNLLRQEYGVAQAILGNGDISDYVFKQLVESAASVSTLRRYTALQKIEPVAQMIREEMKLGLYDKLVIFAIHRDVINGLKIRLDDLGAVTVYGGSNPKTVEQHLKRFQSKSSKVRIIICNIGAAGTSITLTAANQVLFVEHAWVPGDNAQAAARCHRIGQTKPVTVRSVVLPDTIDTRVIEMLSRKTAEISKFLNVNEELQSLL